MPEPKLPYDELEDFVANGDKTPKPPEANPMKEVAETHKPRVADPYINEAIMEAMKDAADAANLTAYAKEIIKRRSATPIDVSVKSDIGEISLPVEGLTRTADNEMIVLRLRNDLLRVKLIPGADMNIVVEGKPHRVSYIGSIRMLESVDMLCFVPYNASADGAPPPSNFDTTRP